MESTKPNPPASDLIWDGLPRTRRDLGAGGIDDWGWTDQKSDPFPDVRPVPTPTSPKGANSPCLISRPVVRLSPSCPTEG